MTMNARMALCLSAALPLVAAAGGNLIPDAKFDGPKPASGVAGTLKVDGVFHAPETFALTVNLATERRLGGRTFKLIDADLIDDVANISGWTVNVVGGSAPYHIYVDGDGDLAIEFIKKGSMLIVR